MKVILTTNIKKLGKVGDQVNVKDGYARNFLLPNRMALRNTKINIEHYEKIKEEINIKEKKRKQEAFDLVESIKKIKIEFVKEADDKDKLYGAVTKKEIINYFIEKNIKLLFDDIILPHNIRSLGEHKIIVNPYEGIETELTVIINKT